MEDEIILYIFIERERWEEVGINMIERIDVLKSELLRTYEWLIITEKLKIHIAIEKGIFGTI